VLIAGIGVSIRRVGRQRRFLLHMNTLLLFILDEGFSKAEDRFPAIPIFSATWILFNTYNADPQVLIFGMISRLRLSLTEFTKSIDDCGESSS